MRIRSHTSVIILGLALTALAHPRPADGQEATPGNALNPRGISSIVERDPEGLGIAEGSRTPTGLLIAKPSAKILYDTLAKGPKLSPEDQVNSTRLFMREMNRFGVSSLGAATTPTEARARVAFRIHAWMPRAGWWGTAAITKER